MRHRRRSVAACAAIACLIVATGCGASATDRFKTRYLAARAPLHQTFVDLANTFIDAKGKTTAEIARSLGTLAHRFGRQLAMLEALKAPPAVAPAFRRLTASLNRVAGDLHATYVAVVHGDLVTAPPAIQSLQRDASAASDAASAVTRKLEHR